ncbi:hypothetical protein DIPPA_19686 [Diplonema papillatum]|nr:hypothetical protein DIPPA_19686 [Diplonema papillatum]
MPEPPVIPPDCSKLYVHTTAECLEGDEQMNEHMVLACNADICADMTNGGEAGFDANGRSFKKSGTTCQTGSTTLTKFTQYICGPPPPYTRYIEQYDLNVFPDYSYIRDVDALSQESGLVIVAGSYELSVMQLQSNGWLKRVGRIPGYYYGALASTDKNTVYGLRSGYLDVVDVSDPTSPKIQGTAQWYGYSCEYLEEYEVGSKRYVFVSCPSYGVWVVDVTDRKTPAVVTSMSTPSLKPTTGMVEGMVIDHVRKLLFLGTSGKVDESGVHMYSLGSSPAIPLEQHRYATDDYTYAIALHGTTIFVAADTKVEVYETKNLKLEPITSCCGFGPDLDLRGITYYNGLLYASDYAGLLVVMNATDPQAPFYIGHRAMPAESGFSQGHPGIVVAPLSDGVVRVIQSAYSGGIIVYTDQEPGPTPAPPTPMPAPPVAPVDCDHIFINPGSSCPLGFVHMSEHLLGKCIALCSSVPVGNYFYDTPTANRYFVKSGTSCRFSTSSTLVATDSVCGSPPPHTTYMEGHKGIFPSNAYVRDVDSLGESGNAIAVASGGGLMVLTSDDSVGFDLVDTYSGYYYAVLTSAKNKDVVFAARSTYVDILSVSPLDDISKLSTATVKGACYHMEQIYKSTTSHTLLVSCLTNGIYTVDVHDTSSPQSSATGFAPLSGSVQGIRYDADRDLLFAVTTGGNAGVHMYNISDVTDPDEHDYFDMNDNGYEVMLMGTIIYVSADEKLHVFETKTLKFEQVGVCCTNAPNLELRGIWLEDGLIYGNDYYAKLIVMNVTDPTAPYYVGHRELPRNDGTLAYGQVGAMIATLKDGVTRVFLAAGSAGLYVLSDTVPAPTPAPPTAMPPPPMVEPDCTMLNVFSASAGDSAVCSEGEVLMNEHIIELCAADLCGKMSVGAVAGFDGPANKVFAQDTCGIKTSSAITTQYICGPPPPLTTYMEVYGEFFFLPYAYTLSVMPMGQLRDEVLVGNSEINVMSLKDNGRLEKIGAYTGTGWDDFMQYPGDMFTVYAVRPYYLDVIDLSDLENPSRLNTFSLYVSSYYCDTLAQYKTSSAHVIYMACDLNGVKLVDASKKASPVMISTGLTVLEGDPRGVLVDDTRGVLFVATEGSSSTSTQHGIYAYDIKTAPKAPVELAHASSADSAYSLRLDGTILYVGAKTRVEIYETKDLATLEQLSWCCTYGPSLDVRNIDFYNGMIYASDYYAKLIVMNVTNTETPYYVGHRDLPSGSYGYKVAVSSLKDNVVRVFQAGYSKGLMVFSDVMPAPTPVPPTPLPPPPVEPLTCSHVFAVEITGVVTQCPDGTTLMNDQHAADCQDQWCDDVPMSEYAKYDYTADNYYFRKTATGCIKYYSSTAVPTWLICGTAPPHTAYVQSHRLSGTARDVAVLGFDSNDVIVATTSGLSIMSASLSTEFKEVGSISGNFWSVIASEHNKDLAYALQSNSLLVVSLTPPSSPEKVSSVVLPVSTCEFMEQYRKTGEFHYVYVSCNANGVYLVDVRDDYAAKLNNKTAILTTTGTGEGLVIDEPRKLLFIATSTQQSVTMFNLANPVAPELIVRETTEYTAGQMKIIGTLLYVGADEKLEIYDTAGNKFEQVGWCCSSYNLLEIMGISIYDNMAYLSDYYYKLTVVNVTDPASPQYIGHRHLPLVDNIYPYGDAGIEVTPLGDGIVRVFQAARSGGLMVFSDTKPMATPVPDTVVPAPPLPALTCDDLYFNDKAATGSTCKDNDVMANRHVIERCLVEVCAKMTPSTTALFDTDDKEALKKDASGQCTFGVRSGTITSSVCGTPPPFTTFRDQYSDGDLPSWTYIYDVMVPSKQSDVVVLAGSELIFMQMQSGGRLKRVGRMPNSYWYYACVAAREQDNVIFATRSRTLDIIDITTPSSPVVLGSAILDTGYSCDGVSEVISTQGHLVFLSCGYYGIWAAEVTTNDAPKSLGEIFRYKVGTSYSYVEGIIADETRNLLFTAYAWLSPGLRMHDFVKGVTALELVEFKETSDDVYQMELHGTVLYVAATGKLEIYETKNRKFELLSSCCTHGPTLDLRGLYFYEGLMYGSEYYGLLVVMNVSDTTAPFYVGHRELPPTDWSGGREGIVVSHLNDGIMRVFQAGYSAGLIVWSDVEIPPTPAPQTPLPQPPPVPADCSHVFLQALVDGQPACPVGTALMPKHIVTSCGDACSTLPDGGCVCFVRRRI